MLRLIKRKAGDDMRKKSFGTTKLVIALLIVCAMLSACGKGERTENIVSQTAENYRNRTYGEYKESTGNDVEFYHGTRFIGEIPDSSICVVYSGEYDEDLAGAVLQDNAVPIRLQGRLADLNNGMEGELSLQALTEMLSADGAAAAECELLEGGGTAYYVGNEYAEIRFDSDRDGTCDATLDISLDESGTEVIYPENTAWLSFENSGEQQTPEEKNQEIYSDSEMISNYSSNPIPGLSCENPQEAGWDLEDAIDTEGRDIGAIEPPGSEDAVYLLEETEHYRLYGKGDYQSMLLECDGKYAQINHPYYSPDYTPFLGMREADYDGDGMMELAIRLNIKRGEGRPVDTLLMADFRSDQNLYVYQLLEEDITAQLMEHVSYEKTEEGIQALMDGKPAGVFFENSEFYGPFEEVRVGENIRFYFRKDTIEVGAYFMFCYEDTDGMSYSVNGSDATATVLWNDSGEFVLTDFRSSHRWMEDEVNEALRKLYGTMDFVITDIRYDSSKINEDSLEVKATILPPDGDSCDYANIKVTRPGNADTMSGWVVEEIRLEKN